MTTDALFAQLKHPNPHLRDRAMAEIAESRDATTIPKLMSILDDEDVVYRRAAVKALGLVGVDAVPAIVEALLQSDNVTVRGSAAKALAQIAINYPDIPFPETGLQGLKQALADVNPVVYIAAAMALGEIGGAAYSILTEAMTTTDNVAVQVSVINAIASVGGDQAAEVLARFAHDQTVDVYVQETAASALSRVEMVKKNTPPGW